MRWLGTQLRLRPVRAAVALLVVGTGLVAAGVLIALESPPARPPAALRVLPAPSPPIALVRTAPLPTSSPPVAVAIPAIALQSPLERLHLTSAGALATPVDPDRVGWYADGPAPGDYGAAVLVGHLDSTTAPAVFWRLGALLPGDRIMVARADGLTVTFVVDHTTVYPRDEVPVDAIYTAVGPELHLITCAGDYHAHAGGYDRRLLVVAKLESRASPGAPVGAAPPAPTFTPLLGR